MQPSTSEPAHLGTHGIHGTPHSRVLSHPTRGEEHEHPDDDSDPNRRDMFQTGRSIQMSTIVFGGPKVLQFPRIGQALGHDPVFRKKPSPNRVACRSTTDPRSRRTTTEPILRARSFPNGRVPESMLATGEGAAGCDWS